MTGCTLMSSKCGSVTLHFEMPCSANPSRVPWLSRGEAHEQEQPGKKRQRRQAQHADTNESSNGYTCIEHNAVLTSIFPSNSGFVHLPLYSPTKGRGRAIWHSWLRFEHPNVSPTPRVRMRSHMLSRLPHLGTTLLFVLLI